MKLYYSAGSCSTSCHITLEESGLKYEATELDFDKPEDAEKVAKMNGMGTLPIFITDDGRQLDQNLSIHAYVADKAGAGKLIAAAGTFERAEALNWLSWVASDLHKTIGALFSLKAISPDKGVQDTVRKFMVERANDVLGYMDDKLEGRDYLMGKNFTPADSYAFVVTGWTKWLDIPLTPFKNVQAYMARVAARPAVAKVLKEEGLT
jgi:glutathione S-transferase